MRHLLLLNFLLLFFGQSSFSITISSVSSGGDWQSKSTWVNNTIPTATDDVIINGTVSGGGVCKDLTVSAAATLQNRGGYGETVTAYGDITNNGKISSSASGSFYISAYGLIKNYGIWQNSQLFLYQTGNALFYQSTGKFFNNMTITAQSGKSDSLIMKTNVQFKSCSYSYSGTNKRVIQSSGHTLDLTACDVANIDFHLNHIIELNNTIIRNCTFRGNGKIQGSFNVNQSATFDGQLTLAGKMTNTNGYGATVRIKGKMTNMDTIKVNKSGYLYLHLDNDFVNEGIYKPTTTYFSSGNSHDISQATGKYFEGNFYNQQTDSIILKSDVKFKKVSFTGTNYTGNGIIKNFGHVLNFDSSTIYGAKLLSNDTILLNGTTLNSASVFGKPTIKGNYIAHGSVVFSGEITNEGVFYNSQGYGSSVEFEGTLTNNGTIALNPLGGSFYVNVACDVINNGIFRPSSTLIKGKTQRSFKQNKTSFFEGTFSTEDTSGGMILNSELTFKNANITWVGVAPYSKLTTNGYNLNLINSDVRHVRLISDDTINSDGSIIRSIDTYRTPKLIGVTKLHSDVIFHNGLVNLDTIYQNTSYGVSVEFYGVIENYGVIATNPGGGAFYVNLHDELFNAGKYHPSNTYLVGKQPIIFRQTKTSVFEGTYTTEDTSGGILMNSELTFNNAHINWTGTAPYSKLISNGYNLNLTNSDVRQIRFISDDTLNFDGSILRSVDVYKTPKLAGKISLHTSVKFNNGLVNLDTLCQNGGYGVTTDLYGPIENYGSIIINPKGGAFYLNIYDALFNAGTYRPTNTYIKDQEVTFSQVDSASFQGYFNTEDTLGGIKLGSNVTFKKANVDMHSFKPYAKINTNTYQLKLEDCNVYEVHITNSDTLHLDGSRLAYVEIEGNPITTGICNLHSNVTFNSDILNLGTLQNTAGYGVSVHFKGKITNNGFVKNNSSGGNLMLNLESGITNNTIFDVNLINLVGKNTRSINGRNVNILRGTCYVNDSMTFVGENFLPNLRVNYPFLLTIDTNSMLTCDDIVGGSYDQIRNRGSIRSNKTPNSYSAFKYDQLSAWFFNTNIKSLQVESYGEQQHPFTKNAINYWWRLKPTPTDVTDTLKELLLSYDEAILNGNNEQDLKLYFSPNAGLDWKKIEQGVTIDTANNIVQLFKAPSYGHYVISGQSIGIINFKPTVNRAEPKLFGNKGTVTIYGFGLGLKDSMKVTLKRAGSSDIVADTSYITDLKGESFLAVFDVDLANIGTYSLHVEMPGEDPMILENYFTIEKAEWPKPWVVLSGRDRFLLNRWQTFNINYGNLTNVDAQGVPLFFVVNDVPGMEVSFPDVQISIPKSFTDDGWTQWKDTVIDLYYVSDSLTGFEGKKMRIYPFYIPSIPALSSNSVRVKIKSSQSLDMTVWVTDPLIEGFEKLKKAGTPPEVAACLAKVTAKYSWDKAIDLIPGYDCYKLAYKVTETSADYALGASKKPATWGSWLVTGWGWAWSVADCAGDLIPISKGVKIGKDLIGLGFDIKSNYDATQECWDKFKPKNKGKHKSEVVNSFDPNEITGPTGYGDDHYISSESNLVYTVYFENKDSATAPASDVIVLDTIDVDQFDLNTFSFNSVTISDSTYEVQAFSKEFRLLIDLSPRINSIVQVTGSLDTISGLIKVTYLTLDKSTLEFIEDVDLGFLPPNKSAPEGEGNFSYSVSLAKDINHDEEIINKALIFFDFNKPIATNVHSNKIDSKSPESNVTGLNPITTDSTFIVDWAGVDQGCGIQYFSVFVSVNDSAYVAWKSNTSLTSDTFFGRDKYKYKFYSIATDSIGLSEIAPDKADTETNVVDKSGIVDLNNYGILIFPNPVQNKLFIELKSEVLTKASFYLLDGRLAKEGMIFQKSNVIDVTDLEAAVYILRLTNEHTTSFSKIVIQE